MKLIEKYFEYTTDISSSKNNIAFLNTTVKMYQMKLES